MATVTAKLKTTAHQTVYSFKLIGILCLAFAFGAISVGLRSDLLE